MLKSFVVFLAALALHSVANALTWDEVVNNRYTLCAKIPPAPMIQPPAAYYKSLSPAQMFCESIKYQSVKQGDKPVPTAPLDLVNQPANGYWYCGLNSSSSDTRLAIDINIAAQGERSQSGSIDKCVAWARQIISDFDTIAMKSKLNALPAFTVKANLAGLNTPTPEQARKTQEEEAKKKAAAAVRAKEMAETVEQAKKRIQAISIETFNQQDTPLPHLQSVFIGKGPSVFCTLSPNERQAFSDEQIKGLTTQAALNLLWCTEREDSPASGPRTLREKVFKECPKNHSGYCGGLCPEGGKCITAG